MSKIFLFKAIEKGMILWIIFHRFIFTEIREFTTILLDFFSCNIAKKNLTADIPPYVLEKLLTLMPRLLATAELNSLIMKLYWSFEKFFQRIM